MINSLINAYGDALAEAVLARGTQRYDDALANAANAENELIAEIDRLRAQRDELLAIAKRYAAECGLCGGHGMRRRLDLDGTPLDDVSCEQCADVRLVIARAEGRSDE
jgi:hypothetical protein